MDNAKQISNAIALTADVGRQVNELLDYLNSMTLQGKLHSSLREKKLAAREEDDDRLFDESEWVVKRFVQNYTILKGKSPKATTYFGYQVDLDGEYLDVGEPLLHVFGRWGIPARCDPDSEDSGTIESPILEDDDYKLAVYEGTLVQWWNRTASDMSEGNQISTDGWLFTARLLALSSPEMADELILGPMKTLLTSTSTALNGLRSSRCFS